MVSLVADLWPIFSVEFFLPTRLHVSMCYCYGRGACFACIAEDHTVFRLTSRRARLREALRRQRVWVQEDPYGGRMEDRDPVRVMSLKRRLLGVEAELAILGRLEQ